MPTDHEDKKKSPRNKFWNFSICNYLDQAMVREIDVRWNTLQISTELMYAKLIGLGFTYYDGKIEIVDFNYH